MDAKEKVRIKKACLLCLRFTSMKSIHEVKDCLKSRLHAWVPYNMLWSALKELEEEKFIEIKHMSVCDMSFEKQPHFRLSILGYFKKRALRH